MNKAFKHTREYLYKKESDRIRSKKTLPERRFYDTYGIWPNKTQLDERLRWEVAKLDFYTIKREPQKTCDTT